MIHDEQCWKAVLAKDKSKDGAFYFAVATTGVFCLPSCAARTPLRRNVLFFETPTEAQAAGFRACLRCHPLEFRSPDANAQLVATMCDYIREHADESLSLAALSRKAGLSPFHFQRVFKAVAGSTPKQFQDACRMERLKSGLREQQPVTKAMYASGFASSSRLYERLDTSLGMTPSEYRSGGKSVRISYASAQTPVGLMMIGATDRGLCFVQFGESDDELLNMLRAEYAAAQIEPIQTPHPEQFTAWMAALTEHLQGVRPHLELPLDLRATAFQMAVWRYLQTIPYGEVQSYSEVAKGIGKPAAVRAVARACASNHVAIVIPCHRVIRGTGELGGYKWGLQRKRVLIDRERASARS